jgi:hypothetical protein
MHPFRLRHFELGESRPVIEEQPCAKATGGEGEVGREFHDGWGLPLHRPCPAFRMYRNAGSSGGRGDRCERTSRKKYPRRQLLIIESLPGKSNRAVTGDWNGELMARFICQSLNPKPICNRDT